MKKLVYIFFLFVGVSIIQSQAGAQDGTAQSDFGDRDPFKRPKYIEDAELEKAAETDNIVTDESIEAIRRWPLRTYKPIAVIWDVSDPKVMVLDSNRTMHLLKKNYRIGNRNGIITEINEGEIVVNENGVPHVMKIEKGTKK